MPANFYTNNAINTDIPIEVEFGGTGAVTLTQNGILLGNGTDPVSATAELSNGQLLIGSTGNAPVPATLTGGFGIAVNNQAGQITISATGQNPWEVVTDATKSIVCGTSYIANGAARVDFSLPTTCAVGTVITLAAANADGFRVEQAAGQSIQFGMVETTAGVTGNLQTTKVGDSITLVTVVEDTKFLVVSSVGNFRVDAA